jgi:hypothetical protein
MLDTRRNPRMGFEPQQPHSNLELVNEFTERMALGIEEAKAALTKAKDEYAMYYNRRHEPAPVYAPGDRVWLDGSDIAINRPSSKLSHRCLGPFLIEACVGHGAYRLALPPCKGTSIRFLILTLLSYSPLVHMYLSHTFVPYPGTTPTKPTTFVFKVRRLSGCRLTESCRHSVFPSTHTSAASDKHWIHGDMSTRYYGTLCVTWTHSNGRLRGLVLYRTLY